MRNVDSKLILVGFFYFLLALLQGQLMAYTADYRFYPMHAHMGLIGGVLMVLYGLIYRAFPAMQQDALVKTHFWLVNIASPIFFAGIGISIAGGTRYVGHAGSISVIIAFIMFALMFLRTNRD
jgi:cbb3-type cytochrome oxidase subunit 1